jgi:hypothetical protein
MMALHTLLSLERPTTKALAYTEWLSPPQVHLESIEASLYYNSNEVKPLL